jgi:hypothetical protein
MRAASAASLAVTGVRSWMSTTAVAPALRAICSAVRRTRACTSRRTAGSKVRMVPNITAESGTMLLRTPALNAPTVTTTGASVRSLCRDTIVCSPWTICAPTTTGSTPAHGVAPCTWRPRTVTEKKSAAAIIPAGRYDRCPASAGVTPTCRPNAASTLGRSSTPALIMSIAPPVSPAGGPSSAGWKRNTTVPGSSARIPASTSAAPMSIATCMSWPQACITPTRWPL